MIKLTATLIVLTNFICVSFAQSSIETTLNSFSRAAAESFDWYDIPAGAMFLSSAYYPLKLRNKLDVDRFSFDRQMQSYVHVPGSKSLGSTDPRRYPEGVFLTRMAATTAAGLFLGFDTHESYKHSLVFFKAVSYNFVVTELIKNITDRKRPDNSDDRSFFSGHTSTSFVTSTFLYMEISELLNENIHNKTVRTSLKAASFGALYGWAGYVGYSRMRDNKHYFSDVLTGAAVGTLIGMYFYNVYFDDEPGFMDNISLGMQNSQPTLSLRFNLN
jgi:membrane-associated phospholipid phosphatase